MEMISKAQAWIEIAMSIGTFIGIIFVIYKTFTAPDIKAAQDIALIKQGCEMKHGEVDNSIKKLAENYTLLKENDIKHIESSMKELEKNQIKIFTILDERLPKKQ